MNTTIKRIAALALLATLLVMPVLAQSPDPNWNRWQRQAYDNLIDWRDAAIRELSDDDTVWRVGDDDVGTYDIALVEEGGYIEFERMFYEENAYFVLASGDVDIRDLDIFIYNSRGEMITYDLEVERDAYVFLENVPTGRYTIELWLYDGAASTSWVGWTVLWSRWP